jgi:hypothetical protein
MSYLRYLERKKHKDCAINENPFTAFNKSSFEIAKHFEFSLSITKLIVRVLTYFSFNTSSTYNSLQITGMYCKEIFETNVILQTHIFFSDEVNFFAAT